MRDVHASAQRKESVAVLRIKRWRLMVQPLAFAAVLATLHIVVFRYRFGVDTQVETLTALLRALDRHYLPQDFFVNSTENFGGRSNYINILAIACSVLPVPYVFLFVTWISHLLIALVTFVTCQDFFPGSRAAPMFAATLVLSVNSTALSDSCILQARMLVPFLMALPWALLALRYGIQGRPARSVLSGSIGALAHPAAIQACLIGIIASPATLLFAGARGTRFSWRACMRELATTAAAAGTLVAGAYVFWIRPYAASLSATELRDIYARYRAPGHLMPSSFGLEPWLLFLTFLAATAVTWNMWWHSRLALRKSQVRTAACIAIVLAICVLGFVGVEIVPIRFVVVASTYRLIFIVKWIGLILLAGFAAEQMGRPLASGRPLLGVLAYFASGTLQPAFVLAATTLEIARRKTVGCGFESIARAVLTVAATALGFAVYRYGDREEFHALLLGAGIVMWFLWVRKPALRTFAPLFGIVFLVALFAFDRMYPNAVSHRIVGGHQPIISIEDDRSEEVLLGEFVKTHVPNDAVFVVPPSGLRFRLTAERAVVVDFKAFPFNDSGIREWFERVRFCYDDSNVADTGVADRLDRAYRVISDQKLAEIRAKYGATYAVLYRETTSGYPVIFESEHYTIVRFD